MTLGVRTKFIIQLVLMVGIGVYYQKSKEWIALCSWVIISIELMIYVFNLNDEVDDVVAEFSKYHKKRLNDTSRKFGSILKEHFGIKGNFGTVDISTIEMTFFLIVLIYLPFVVLPLIAINSLRFLKDFMFFVSDRLASVPLKIIPASSDSISEVRKVTKAFTYAIIFVGFFVGLVYFSILHTTLIK